MTFAFLRAFAHMRHRAAMAGDPTLGPGFVLDGLVIEDSAFDFKQQSNLVPTFVVPVTSIWSHCIVVPLPMEAGRRRRVTLRPTHLIFPVRREPNRP